MIVSEVLDYLEVAEQRPSLAYLDAIIRAWSQRIPWESMSRIARHQFTGTPEQYTRLPDAFYRDALALGTGGTCFESNLALRALLQPLGFDCGPVFCSMETAILNPHCALLVRLDGGLYLADVGYPVPGAFRMDSKLTTLDTPVYRYQATPLMQNHWEIRRFSGEFEYLCFVVQGNIVDEPTFYARLLRDHQPDGLFLTEAIIHRAQGSEMLRYSEDKGLVRRSWGHEERVALSPDEELDLPKTLSRLFGMNEAVLRAALHRKPDAELGRYLDW